jgi:hypothetical protein
LADQSVAPSTSLTDQPAAPSASSSQRKEIALKQVSYPAPINIFTGILIME